MCVSGSAIAACSATRAVSGAATGASAPSPTSYRHFDTRPVVAILGLYRGGTSAAAGTLQKLGLQMGQLLPGSQDNPGGFYEDIFLRARLQWMWGEPSFARCPRRPEQAAVLREWRRSLATEQSMSGVMVAVKHPLLCLMGQQMIKSWGPATRFISIVRQMDDCLESLARVGWWPAGVGRMIQQRLWDAREVFLVHTPHLQLEYDELLSDPEAQIARIIEYLSLDVSRPVLAAARDFIRKRPDRS